uniref:Uncharacterized protein n=1 Tax=Sipha flava TaxID=143950 RepID=A0A2S2QHZ5_9HEMI
MREKSRGPHLSVFTGVWGEPMRPADSAHRFTRAMRCYRVATAEDPRGPNGRRPHAITLLIRRKDVRNVIAFPSSFLLFTSAVVSVASTINYQTSVISRGVFRLSPTKMVEGRLIYFSLIWAQNWQV